MADIPIYFAYGINYILDINGSSCDASENWLPHVNHTFTHLDYVFF